MKREIKQGGLLGLDLLALDSNWVGLEVVHNKLTGVQYIDQESQDGVIHIKS